MRILSRVLHKHIKDTMERKETLLKGGKAEIFPELKQRAVPFDLQTTNTEANK